MASTNSLSSYYEKFLATGEVKCIDEEIPFEIPKGWEWARFGNIVNHSPQVTCEDNLEVAFMPMALIDAGYRSSYTFEKRYWKNVKSGFTKMQKGDIAYAKITPCFQNRKSFILGDVPSNIATATTELNVIRIYADTFARWYLLYILKSDFFIKEAKYKGTAGQQRVLSDYVKSKLLPIPPRKEQDRICDKLQEVLPIVDNYDKSQSELNSLNSTIGERLKKTILQEAIQGKLVPQIPEEGTAQELLEQIRQEKQKLVKEGKLRKSVLSDSVIYKGDDNKYYEQVGKSDKEITEEIAFDLPNGWSWCRLKDICSIFTGATFKKEETVTTKEGVRILRGGNISPFELRIKDDDIFLTKDKVKEDIILKENDILTPAVTSLENIGKMVQVNNDMPNTTVGGFVFIIRLYLKNQWLSKYILYLLSSPFMIDFMKSITNKSGQAFYNIGKERLSTALLPIPSLAEQHRIVAQIEKLFEQLR